MTPVSHPCLPEAGTLWGAGRPAFPDEPAPRYAIEAGAARWKAAGVRAVVSLMEAEEIRAKCPGLHEACRRHGLEVIHFPIRDYGVPTDLPAFRGLLAELRARLARGEDVLVHCNGGLGRTAVVLAGLLRAGGLDSDPVAEVRRVYQRRAILDSAQEAFVRGFDPADDGRPR